MKLKTCCVLLLCLPAFAGEWSAHQTSLTAQRAALEQSKKTMMELNLSLAKAKDEASRKEINKQVDKLKKQLRDDEARFTEETAHVALQHPEQGENIKTVLDAKRVYNYAPKAQVTVQKQGLGELLNRVHDKMVSLYGDHSLPVEKRKLEFKFQKEAEEQRNIEHNRPALSLDVKDDGNREPVHEMPHAKPAEAAKNGGH